MATSSGPKPPTGSGTRRRVARVLIVDDDRRLGSVLARLLSDEHEVVFVDDASDALVRLNDGHTFDLILCDVMMPSMNGVEFYERLVAVQPAQAQRVVFMSGGGLTPKVERFFATIPNLLLAKPVDRDGLRALIERRVGGAEQARPAHQA